VFLDKDKKMYNVQKHNICNLFAVCSTALSVGGAFTKWVTHLAVMFINVILFGHFCDLYFVLISDRNRFNFHYYEYYCISHILVSLFLQQNIHTSETDGIMCTAFDRN
jgi:uncharacterized membrane protein YczE